MRKKIIGIFVCTLLILSFAISSPGTYTTSTPSLEKNPIMKMYDDHTIVTSDPTFETHCIINNTPPNTPNKPSGPISGITCIWYPYSTYTTDPDGDDVRYGWDFNGDGIVNEDNWTPFHPSGVMCNVWILFVYSGTYYLSVIAEDINGTQSNFSPTLTVVISDNMPPNTPNRPSGYSSGTVGTPYTYSTYTNDFDGNNIKYGWDWDGDSIVDEWTGFYSSGSACSVSHSWPSANTYYVKVKAEDVHGAQSGFSSALTVVISSENHPPDKPARPSGSTHGKVGVSYSYESLTNDPDGDHIYYMFDWDDGTTSEWKGPYNSGDSICVSHIWNVRGSYAVKVKAKDSHGLEGIWSDPLPISMPKNKAIDHPFLRFLENHPNMFPILRHILGYNL